MKILRVACYLFVLLLFLVAFAFSASASPARAAPATVAKFKFSSTSAFAFFDNVVGCVDTNVSLDAFTSNNSSEADIFIGQFNFCTNTQLLAAFGSTFSPTFQVSKMFASASLSATIPVFDEVSGNMFNVSVSQTWTASGPISIEAGASIFHTKGFTDSYHFHGKFRNATASGTVSDGTTNFTPSPSLFAQIGNFTSGEVVITQP